MNLKTIECPLCGGEMKYKTKPPKMCVKCKKATEKLKKKKRSNPVERSKEMKMFNELDKLLPNQFYIRNGYYSFLISPKKQPMQYDIYYPELKLAFE